MVRSPGAYMSTNNGCGVQKQKMRRAAMSSGNNTRSRAAGQMQGGCREQRQKHSPMSRSQMA